MRYVTPLAAASSPAPITSHPGTPYVDLQQQASGIQQIIGIAAQTGMGQVGEGDFMLESDLGFLNTMLPPMNAGQTAGAGSAEGWGDGGWGSMGGFGA